MTDSNFITIKKKLSNGYDPKPLKPYDLLPNKCIYKELRSKIIKENDLSPFSTVSFCGKKNRDVVKEDVEVEIKEDNFFSNSTPQDLFNQYNEVYPTSKPIKKTRVFFEVPENMLNNCMSSISTDLILSKIVFCTEHEDGTATVSKPFYFDNKLFVPDQSIENFYTKVTLNNEEELPINVYGPSGRCDKVKMKYAMSGDGLKAEVQKIIKKENENHQQTLKNIFIRARDLSQDEVESYNIIKVEDNNVYYMTEVGKESKLINVEVLYTVQPKINNEVTINLPEKVINYLYSKEETYKVACSKIMERSDVKGKYMVTGFKDKNQQPVSLLHKIDPNKAPFEAILQPKEKPPTQAQEQAYAPKEQPKENISMPVPAPKEQPAKPPPKKEPDSPRLVNLGNTAYQSSMFVSPTFRYEHNEKYNEIYDITKNRFASEVASLLDMDMATTASWVLTNRLPTPHQLYTAISKIYDLATEQQVKQAFDELEKENGSGEFGYNFSLNDVIERLQGQEATNKGASFPTNYVSTEHREPPKKTSNYEASDYEAQIQQIESRINRENYLDVVLNPEKYCDNINDKDESYNDFRLMLAERYQDYVTTREIKDFVERSKWPHLLDEISSDKTIKENIEYIITNI